MTYPGPDQLEQLRTKLWQRLERVEEEMLDTCPFCSRYNELEAERRVILARLKQLDVRPY